ncbi:TPA: hypothetical protein I8010_001639 [Legionella pneumophila]|nr:hypothetical protein [Legionella pneumophila]HAT1993811.1 hypothetical protein [Legionella pneumophila]HAT2051458.1 hypothetical protein [Legionella pneumophila]HAT2060859.1 hypothetical protein [Legionella pneumophila]HAT4462890.1 hypothetical protein [Legionella pneumophila]
MRKLSMELYLKNLSKRYKTAGKHEKIAYCKSCVRLVVYAIRLLNTPPKHKIKTWTHVKQLFGYARFDNQALIELMNDL